MLMNACLFTDSRNEFGTQARHDVPKVEIPAGTSGPHLRGHPSGYPSQPAANPVQAAGYPSQAAAQPSPSAAVLSQQAADGAPSQPAADEDVSASEEDEDQKGEGVPRAIPQAFVNEDGEEYLEDLDRDENAQLLVRHALRFLLRNVLR